jgi:hypothetical protein
MAQGTLVDRQVEDGRQLLEQLARAGFPVAAAWWLKPFVEVEEWEPFHLPYEEREWEFYLASPVVEAEGSAKAYRSIHEALRQLHPTYDPTVAAISMSRITAVDADHPATQEVRKIMRLYRAKPPIYVARCRLGKIEAKEVYIYPSIVSERAPTTPPRDHPLDFSARPPDEMPTRVTLRRVEIGGPGGPFEQWRLEAGDDRWTFPMTSQYESDYLAWLRQYGYDPVAHTAPPEFCRVVVAGSEAAHQ